LRDEDRGEREAAMIAGKSCGSVTWRNVPHRVPPRSAEASSSDRSIPASRARTTSVTIETLNTEWVSTIAHAPRGKPTVVKNSSEAMAMTISGMTRFV
jgi:hypothetical protein